MRTRAGRVHRPELPVLLAVDQQLGRMNSDGDEAAA